MPGELVSGVVGGGGGGRIGFLGGGVRGCMEEKCRVGKGTFFFFFF